MNVRATLVDLHHAPLPLLLLFYKVAYDKLHTDVLNMYTLWFFSVLHHMGQRERGISSPPTQLSYTLQKEITLPDYKQNSWYNTVILVALTYSDTYIVTKTVLHSLKI